MNITHNSPEKKARKQLHRASKVDAGFSYTVGGVEHLFQTDILARSNVTGRASKVTAKRSLGQIVPDFEWRSTDNVMVSFTGVEFLEFAIAMDEFVESQYQDSWSES
jgi:hypothetical protein